MFLNYWLKKKMLDLGYSLNVPKLLTALLFRSTLFIYI